MNMQMLLNQKMGERQDYKSKQFKLSGESKKGKWGFQIIASEKQFSKEAKIDHKSKFVN